MPARRPRLAGILDGTLAESVGQRQPAGHPLGYVIPQVDARWIGEGEQKVHQLREFALGEIYRRLLALLGNGGHHDRVFQ